MVSTKSRSLTWSKEVERRVRDLYKKLYPEANRTKFFGRELAGSTDIVGVPYHVQVKARKATWVGTTFRAADLANKSGFPTHLVTQDSTGEPLLTLRLSDYVNERLK